MSLIAALTLVILGVPVLLVLLVALVLWVRTIRARRRAEVSRLTDDAPQLPEADDE